jgi:hypothetical protein
MDEEQNLCEDSWFTLLKPCEGEVTYEPCPYASEIAEDYTPVWLCEYHRGERAYEI